MPVFRCATLAVACLSAALAQPRFGPPPLPPGVKVDRNLVYAHASGRDLLLDIYRPETQDGGIPAVVWIHGGAFRAGSKDDGQVRATLWLVNHGYAVASINYRLSQVAKFPAQTHDTKAAIRWLRANGKQYGLDTARIAAWGASAGGHLSAMLGTSGGDPGLEGDLGHPEESSRVQAVVNFYGPTDFLQMDAQSLPGGMKHDSPDSPESQLIGGPIQEHPEKAARANPITYVSPDDAPFLILHGEQDLLVPPGQSGLLFTALRKAGVELTFHKIAGAGHGGPSFNTSIVRAMVLAFLDQHLKPPASAGK
jgi:acetyl esterase/lipase